MALAPDTHTLFHNCQANIRKRQTPHHVSNVRVSSISSSSENELWRAI
jgi:hypothetical protein